MFKRMYYKPSFLQIFKLLKLSVENWERRCKIIGDVVVKTSIGSRGNVESIEVAITVKHVYRSLGSKVLHNETRGINFNRTIIIFSKFTDINNVLM